MARVLTNNFNLAYGIETALGVSPTGSADWKNLEPNTINQFGADITTVARQPISANRQNQKGTIVDLDSSVEFEADYTQDAFQDFMEGFVFSNAVNADLFFRPSAVTGTGYTVPALNATQGGKLQFGATAPTSILFARGFNTADNNGQKVLSADAASTDTELQVSGLTAEATPPSNVIVEVAGIRADTADLDVDRSGTTITITSGNGGGTALDFTTLGLTVGQFIHVGGTAAANQFTLTDAVGYMRVKSIAAGTLTGDKASGTLATFTGGPVLSTGKKIDLLFGRFVRNLPTTDSNFLERSYVFEGTFPNLASGPADAYEYAEGNFANQLTVNIPLTDKATFTFSFVGTDAPAPTTTRRMGASTALDPTQTTALNTSSDLLRFRILDTNETELTADLKSATVTLNNNVTPEKVLANLGAKFLNTGNFEVTLETQIVFSSDLPIARIRNNTTVSLDAILKNDDGAVALDIPSMTLGGGGREYPANESILANITGTAFQDATLSTSFSASLFPVAP